MRCGTRVVLVVALGGAAPMGAVADVTLGQSDTFQDGTTQGWGAGNPHPAPPSVVATGGPGGAGDQYLQLTALGGGGIGSRLAAFNTSQWAGDYPAAGVTAVTLDVRNLGPDDAFLRLRIWDAVAGTPSNIAITDAVMVPAGSGWVQATFAVDAASLTAILGDAGAALANATELRLFHNPAADYPGPPIGPPPVNLMLGVDNISAVPGPGGAVLVAGGLAAVARRRRRSA